MLRKIFLASILSLFVLALTHGYTASAQNVSTNVSNATGNTSAAVNNTASELGQNASEFGKNASEVRKDILNKTGEGVKKFLGGAADVVSNASEEVKEGIGK